MHTKFWWGSLEGRDNIEMDCQENGCRLISFGLGQVSVADPSEHCEERLT